ncbi:hypothetical protein GGS20DRAFT_415989 [Poronia punctata]|nr:hypothetical protein GGS20DRAFT_415989 [Poronia punctata]
MTTLEIIFGELGISQYLNEFIEQGFDSWDTIVDITESDLDALGVKLGHRRKLQRRIANYRGVAADASLTSPTRSSIEYTRPESSRTELVRGDSTSRSTPTVTKRKYRRHPKPDENAPERPPSAYVLFSNKMREDLKGQNLTFTEIAKLVGEHWQSLGRTEKEPFEKQANEAKEKYNYDLAQYKQTPEYRKYHEYLHEFRKKQAVQNQEKDAAKRLKLDAESVRGSSTSTGSVRNGTATTSVTGSGAESQQGSEPPPSRQQRFGSIASMSTGTSHMDDPITSPNITSDEPIYSRGRGLSSPQSRDLPMPSAARSGWPDSQPYHGDPSVTGVPWLDPRAPPTSITHSPENSGLGMHPAPDRRHGTRSVRTSASSASTSGSTSISQLPSLKDEQSSSTSSSSPSPYPPRTPNDASLPIHALLSSKMKDPQSIYLQGGPHRMINTQMSQAPPPRQQTQFDRDGPQGNFQGTPHYNNGPGFMQGVQPSRPGQTRPYSQAQEELAVPYERNSSTPMPKHGGNGENGLDGISALLRAREIVDRRP